MFDWHTGQEAYETASINQKMDGPERKFAQAQTKGLASTPSPTPLSLEGVSPRSLSVYGAIPPYDRLAFAIKLPEPPPGFFWGLDRNYAREYRWKLLMR